MSRSSRLARSAALAAAAACAALAGTAAGAPGQPPAVIAQAPSPPSLPPTPSPASPGTQVEAPAGPAGRAGGSATVRLTRIYRGDDGSALYLRRLGDRVVGFGEHPGLGYAYVVSGTAHADERITASWWDVPKGGRSDRGSLTLRWSQLGARVVRSGGADLGPDVFTAVEAEGIPWPPLRTAGFQSTSVSDLDGAFTGDDESRHYVRQSGTDTVWVAEHAAQPGERPAWVSVFVGTRAASGGVAGEWLDVPKGLVLRQGTFGAAPIGSGRSLALAQTGTDGVRTRTLTPDYAVDWQAFADGIESALDGRVVGYGYAIVRHGGLVRTGAGGWRRLDVDGGRLPFTADTQSQTASAAKTVSAAAIVKALHARGLGVDARVAPFLPSCIEQGPGVATLTFRQILDHTSGLRGARGFDTQESCNGRDPYECLLDVLSTGRVFDRTYAYNNKAYDLLRLLVPLVADPVGTQATFALFDCRDTKGVLQQRIASAFARYVLDEVLAPAGAGGSWSPWGDFSLNYACAPTGPTGPCAPTRPGERMNAGYLLRSGSGKMAMSAKDYALFLSALDRGLIVPKGLVEQMKAERLGFDSAAAGRAGAYPWKNGGCPSLESPGWGRGCATVGMIFPGDVQAYVTVNSSGNAIGRSMQSMLQRAYDAALR